MVFIPVKTMFSWDMLYIPTLQFHEIHVAKSRRYDFSELNIFSEVQKSPLSISIDSAMMGTCRQVITIRSVQNYLLK